MKGLKLAVRVATVVLSISALFVLGACAQQEAYAPPQNVPVVNTPTLSEEGVLKVGVDTSNAPLAGTTSSSGKIVGIDVDIASALADELGLKVEFVDVGSDASSALSDGTVDVVMGINKATADGSFWVSDEYLPTTIVLFAKSSGSAPAANSSATIGAQVSSTSSWAVTNQFENATLDTAGDLNVVFKSLADGNVDYVASDAVKGLYSASRQDFEPTIVALMQSVSGYGVGVKDTNSELKQAISDALNTITTNGVIDVIEEKWLGEVLDLKSISMTDAAQAAVNSTATNAEAAQTTSEQSAESSEAAAEQTGADAEANTDGGEASADTAAQADSAAAETTPSESPDTSTEAAAA